jgi:type IV pilus assembly protein PilW
MNNHQHHFTRQSGLTLIELMVGLALGVLLLFGVGLLFSQNKQSYLQNEQLARLQEDARFAIDELSRDISMAGFMAEITDSNVLAVGISAGQQTALVTGVDCVNSGRNWLYDFSAGLSESALLAGDNVLSEAAAQALLSCIPGGFRADTDIIAIKRTSGVPSATAIVGRPFIRENGQLGVLYQGGNPPVSGTADPDRIVATPFNEWEYTPRIYYIREIDGIPTLCRRRLAAGLVEECIAQGVEDMQFEYGLDTTEDGFANVYVTNPVGADLARVVSVRIYLRMRTTNQDMGYQDDRTYTLSNSAMDPTPGGRFHRRIYASTVMVRNINSNRLGPVL